MLNKSNGRSLRTGFIDSVSRYPDSSALVVRDKSFSYSEIDVRSRKWANCIVSVCDRKPERIGIFAYRSEVSYVATIATLMAGATFVPLNPTFPSDKTAAMIDRADLDAIIVDQSCSSKVGSVLSAEKSIPLIFPDAEERIAGIESPSILRQQLESYQQLIDLPPLTPEDMAYLLFTSGSTGTPKGVPVTHGNAVHFIDLMSKRYAVRPDDRFSQTFDQTFDLSVFDIFMAWFNGASLYAMSPLELLAPSGFINRNRLTVWFSVPSVVIQMMKRGTLKPGGLPSLRLSLFCGEPLECRMAQSWQDAAPHSIVENLYGPTELTIACFAYTWNSQSSPALCKNDYVPIGMPLEGLSACIVDETTGQMTSDGPGELAVSGPQTTPGYWNDPEQTKLKFVFLPVSKHESRRFYRTGDRVMRLPESSFAFLGRTDQQIKVLGHRVELGEVETVLRRGAGVEYAVAFGWPTSTLNAESVVAVVSGDSVDIDALKRLASAALPPYMVPKQIHRRESMPLNANGKVDRNVVKKDLEGATT